MYTVDVKIEQISHKVFQQYASHFGASYTVKLVQSTVDEPWYNIQSTWNVENITNEPNLNSWKRMQSGGKHEETRSTSILQSYGLTSFLISYAAIGSPLKWKLRFHRQLAFFGNIQ